MCPLLLVGFVSYVQNLVHLKIASQVTKLGKDAKNCFRICGSKAVAEV